MLRIPTTAPMYGWLFVYGAALWVVALGCQRQPDYPRVVYNDYQPPANPKHIVTLDVFPLADVDSSIPREIKLPDRVASLDEFAFQGQIDPSHVATPPHCVLIVLREKKNNKRIVVNSMAQPLSPDGAMLKFDLRLNAPAKSGSYIAELFAMSQDVPLLCIAQGQLQVD